MGKKKVGETKRGRGSSKVAKIAKLSKAGKAKRGMQGEMQENKVRKEQKKKGALSKKRVARKKVRKLTFGVTDSLMSVALYLLYVTVNMPGGRGPAGVHRAFDKADEWIEKFDGKKLRKTLYNLQQRGLISSLKEAATLPLITEAGMRRIESVFPFYDEERVWDKLLYLVLYDFSKKNNRDRDVFRGVLEDLKAVRLQRSVYLTPYNPRDLVRRVSEEHNLQGEILISTVDPKDAFGYKGNIKDYLWDVYGLEDVNDCYARFIGYNGHLSKEAARKKRTEIVFSYLSVLRDDPQLPFELLPDEYLGDEAHLLFRRLVGFKT